MSKKLILTVLISTLLGGCSQENDLRIEESQGILGDQSETIELQNSDLIETENSNLSETEGDLYYEYVSEYPVELKLYKELEGNKIIPLSDNRFLLESDEKSVIYDDNFDVIKEVGEIKFSAKISCGAFTTCQDVFAFEQPFFTDGQMKSKIGLMDLDGNIISPAGTIDEDSFDDEFRVYVVDDSIYREDYKEEVLAVKRDGNKIGLSLLVVSSDDYEVVKTLIEPKYYQFDLDGYGCISSDCQYEELWMEDSNRVSLAFKNDNKWGIVDFEGNNLLEAEYGGIYHLGYNEEESIDYYRVINELGKAGIFSSKDGWIIDPTFSYDDEMKMIASNIFVKLNASECTQIYDNTGNLIYEFEFIAGIYDIEDLSGTDKISNKFFNVTRSDIDFNLGMYNNDLQQIPESTEYESYATILDKVIVGCRSSKCDLLTIDGIFVTSLPCTSLSDIEVVGEKYLLIGTNVYELIEL